jgi:hypothetical protein
MQGIDWESLNQVYVDGRQVPIIVNGEQDGQFGPNDSIEFYGVGLNSAATHGSVNQWRGNILTNDDAATLTNQNLSFFIMLSSFHRAGNRPNP